LMHIVDEVFADQIQQLDGFAKESSGAPASGPDRLYELFRPLRPAVDGRRRRPLR
jgi:hypothetical protein